MNYGIREQVLLEIKELAKKYNIEQVILFEVCFEQSWKAMKELLVQSGYDSGL